tara:strand:+ start:834 stop:1022 length:189 start_codon:yes stop_codon:yes gene_type:complete
MTGVVYFDGNVSSMPTGLTSSGLTIIITTVDNVNAWASYDSGEWKINVSDSEYKGNVYYIFE